MSDSGGENRRMTMTQAPHQRAPGVH
jgi:hypothetical protein